MVCQPTSSAQKNAWQLTTIHRGSDIELCDFFAYLLRIYLSSIPASTQHIVLIKLLTRVSFRWLVSPVVIDQLPDRVHVVLCQQIGVEIPVAVYNASDRTSRLHAERARKYLGWTKYSLSMDPSLIEWLKG